MSYWNSGGLIDECESVINCVNKIQMQPREAKDFFDASIKRKL